jgi:hypothetical protein
MLCENLALGVVTDDSGVDKATQVKSLRSEHGHDGGSIRHSRQCIQARAAMGR